MNKYHTLPHHSHNNSCIHIMHPTESVTNQTYNNHTKSCNRNKPHTHTHLSLLSFTPFSDYISQTIKAPNFWLIRLDRNAYVHHDSYVLVLCYRALVCVVSKCYSHYSLHGGSVKKFKFWLIFCIDLVTKS